jgi:hypothetical protein
MTFVRLITLLVSFFRGGSSFLEPDEAALHAAGVNRERYVIGHRRIVNLARFFGIMGLVLWSGALIFGSVVVGVQFDNPGKAFVVCLSPFLGCMLGATVGAILGCLLAPRDFLHGPLGRKWLSFIGTENVLVARVVCFVCFILLGYFFVSMTFLNIASSLNLYPPSLLQGEIDYMNEKGLPIKSE